eukprot:TRINITY_DN47376_c0_g2_i2.p1 TRINITY_DN47376_c0_g2~~TRINITY_DN47376_c0_g2_i2.p1  ORF type:complete len:462 (+),score=140.73 TRINITY_DN47376_c0_g2_i2:74-1459(+)
MGATFMDSGAEHIQVPEELAALGGPPCDTLALASGACRKKVTEESRAEGLAWAASAMRGWRVSMEDVHIAMPFGYLGGSWRDAALFGVLDGHGGEQVARFVARHLPGVLAEFPSENPEESLANALGRMDELLRLPSAAKELRELTIAGNEPKDSADSTGTTSVTCVVRGDELLVANIGDSRAVLCRGGKAVMLTEDHKPNVAREKERIHAAGGFVQEEALPGGRGMDYRVNGNLNLSRAIGDLKFKADRFRPQDEQLISAAPDTLSRKIEAKEDEFILMGCDGLWECMTVQAAVDFVRRRLPPVGTPRGLAPVLEQLLDACCADTPTQRGGLGCDNITALLIRFEDPEEAQKNAAACGGGGEAAEEKELMSEAASRRLEAMLSQTLQRLSKKPTKEAIQVSKEEREEQARLEREAEEKQERERLERRKRREEREAKAKSDKKRLRFCAAADEEEEDDDEEF